ncbi:MAG: hypothetical protein OEV44_11030 [Spirochaetota bacterium]|nr:hypothetical protein [Spirochaetota bacterium]
MSLRPLDLQIVIGQMDYAGSSYLKLYTAARKDQIHHGVLYEQRSQEIDHKVLDLPEDVNDYQEAYLDPHDSENPRKNAGHFKKKTLGKSDSKDENLPRELDKGNFIDTRQ